MSDWQSIESAFAMLEEQLHLLQAERDQKAAELAALDGEINVARTCLNRSLGLLNGNPPLPTTPTELHLQEQVVQRNRDRAPALPSNGRATVQVEMSTEPSCSLSLPHGHRVLLDPEDYEWAKSHKWKWRKDGGVYRDVYRTEGELGAQHTCVFLHRQIMGNPTGYVVFENGNKMDCRRNNLKVLNKSEGGREFRTTQLQVVRGGS